MSILILQDGRFYSEPFVVLNMILLTICTFSLFFNKTPYSLYKTFHLFVLAFFLTRLGLLKVYSSVLFSDLLFPEEQRKYSKMHRS